MFDGIYRLVVSHPTGVAEHFRAAVLEGELTAWNANFSLSGSVNYYNAEIHLRTLNNGPLKASVIGSRGHYSFQGFTTIHSDGFIVIEPDSLLLVIVGIREDNYLHI